MKKIISLVLTGVMCTSLCFPAFAATNGTDVENTSPEVTTTIVADSTASGFSLISPLSTTYTSTINVGSGSSVYGTSRSYDAGTFGCAVTSINCDPIENNGTLTAKLSTVSFGQYSTVSSQGKAITSSTRAATYSLGYHAAKNYAFVFTTTPSLKLSAQVSMYSRT